MTSSAYSGNARAAAKLKTLSASVAVRHHSNSIASGTVLSTSPTGSMLSASSMSSSLSSSSSKSRLSSTSSSLGSNCSAGGIASRSCNDNGFFANRKNQNYSSRTHGGGWHRRPSGKLNLVSGNKILESQQQQQQQQQCFGSNYCKSRNQNQIQSVSDRQQKHQQGGIQVSSAGCHSPNSPNLFASNLTSNDGGRKSNNRNGKSKGSIRNVNKEEFIGTAAEFFSSLQQQHQQLSPTAPIPTNLTHFAGSKCFDAPAPTALPKPPQHWTMAGGNSTGAISGTKLKEAAVAGHGLLALPSGGCGARGGAFGMNSWKRNLLDDFDTHNLKLLLNVQS